MKKIHTDRTGALKMVSLIQVRKYLNYSTGMGFGEKKRFMN